MKVRYSYVTNSSSSSFIIANNTNEHLTSKEIIMKLFEKILKDAEGRFELAPGEHIEYICGDHAEDGAFENFIHQEFATFGDWFLYNTDDVDIIFKESYH